MTELTHQTLLDSLKRKKLYTDVKKKKKEISDKQEMRASEYETNHTNKTSLGFYTVCEACAPKILY